MLLAHLVNSFWRFRAIAKSSTGVDPSFLDEPVQRHQVLAVKAEQNACRPLCRQVCPDFP
jgi:hypothetical protein